MTKKEKHKKETLAPKEENEKKTDPNNEKVKDDRKSSKSRSRSRRRRSLSALFRKSRGRTQSADRSDLLSNDVANANVPETDPRTNPRGHLQRMTVREALARNRGRSPNRRLRKLEKKILNDEPRLSGGSLSISLPHLPNHISEDQSEAPTYLPELSADRSGSTLPRVKKKRGYSEGTDAQIFRQHDYQDSNISNLQDKPVQILPLDKRKYLINKDLRLTDPLDLDDHSNNETNQMHSSRYEHAIPDEMTENERRRRESYIQFLSLREKKPAHAHIQGVSEQKCDNVNDTQPNLTTVSETEPTVVMPNIQTLEDGIEKNKSEQSSVVERTESETNKKNDEEDTQAKSVEDLNTKYRDTTDSSIPLDKNWSNKSNKVKRSTYVSPRRFSRSSRTSVTSDKSINSSSNIHLITSEQKQSKPPNDAERGRVKYQRYFSRESRKKISDSDEKGGINSKEQQKVDASTSMDELCSVFITTEDEILQNNVEITEKYEKAFTEKGLHSVVNKEIEDGEELVLNSKPEKKTNLTDTKTGICPEEGTLEKVDLSPLKREIVVIDVEKNIQPHENDSVFRPIQPDRDMTLAEEGGTNILKRERTDFDTDKIEVISSDIITENVQAGGKCDSSVEDSKVSEDHQNQTKDIKNSAEKNIGDNQDKDDKNKKKFWSGKSKKDKTKSKKKKEKNRKSSAASNKSNEKESAEKNDVQIQISPEKDKTAVLLNCEKEHVKSLPEPVPVKKRKSILKKRNKQKQNKSKDSKPITRRASFSKFVEKQESIISEERRKSISTLNKRSRSMDDISKQTDDQTITLEHKKLKEGRLKPDKEESKIAETKEIKHQPRLSIAAIVALRAKISRMKKAKQLQKNMNNHKESEDSDLKEKAITPRGDSIQEKDENADMSLAKVFYENEINTSLGKSDNSINIIDDTDQEVKDLVYDKRIKFAPYCDDTISEEEMIKQRQRNTRLTTRRESKVRQRQKKVINCCKKGIAFLFSHIGLCSLVVGYCILGGIIFKALEGDNEIEQKKEIRELRQNFTEKIYRLAFETTLTKGSREVFIKEVNEILKNFSVMIHKQTKEAGWDGKEIKMVTNDLAEPLEPEPEQWSYPSSLLYAITVMTTIGYGHVAPKTDEGRIMTIAYAVLGIPLTLLCLTNIGDLMAHGFRSLYGKVCCGLCCILFRPRRRRRLDPERGLSGAEERMIMQENEKSGELIHVPTSVCLLLMSSYIMLGTFLFAEWEDWDVVTGTYFCFITLSTIGFGDVVPGMSQSDWDQQEKLVSCALYLVFGLSLIAMCFNLVQEDVKAKCKWLGMKLGIIDKPVSSV